MFSVDSYNNRRCDCWNLKHPSCTDNILFRLNRDYFTVLLHYFLIYVVLKWTTRMLLQETCANSIILPLSYRGYIWLNITLKRVSQLEQEIRQRKSLLSLFFNEPPLLTFQAILWLNRQFSASATALFINQTNVANKISIRYSARYILECVVFASLVVIIY